MAEKDRRPGQNGKGSGNRITDIKKFKSNYEEIKWENRQRRSRVSERVKHPNEQ